MRSGGTGPRMVVLAAGRHAVGNLLDKARIGGAAPATFATLGAFAIGDTEVTVGEYRRFVHAAAYVTDAERNAYGYAGCYV